MEKNYTLVHGYGHIFCKNMEEVKAKIENELKEYAELKPTLINSTKSVYKTFFGDKVEIETFTYMYKTYYTETFVVYSGDDFEPLGTIKDDLQTQEHRKEVQPQTKEDIKKFKKYLHENNCTAIVTNNYSTTSGVIEFLKEGKQLFTIKGIEREMDFIDCESEEEKELANEIYNRFIEITGYMFDILAAF